MRGTILRDGSMLVGDNGALAIVDAAPQPLARITADDPLRLTRAVYHLANRHVPVQLEADHVLIERDPVLERMLVSLGACVAHVELPFEPEGGAYAADEHGHGHNHGSHRDEVDDISATMGEQLSIAAHQARDSRS
jgi:urease accessory protein